MNRVILVLVLALPTACKEHPPAAPIQQPEETPDERPMDHSFFRANEIEAALVFGDLAGARAAARTMVDNLAPDEVPVRWRSHAHAVHNAARQLADAQELRNAVWSAAEMAAACGACHRSEGVELQPPTPPNRPQLDGLASHMQRHAWGADRLWAGLIASSDEAWNEGAQALTIAPFQLATWKGRVPPPEATVLADRVHGIGASALQQSEPSERTGHFAELLLSCAECHALAGVERNVLAAR